MPQNKKKITKAVVPVAGSGTRLMPLTMHQPKALVGVASKPILHHLIDELSASGIQKVYIVHRPDQTAILDYLGYLKNFLRQEKSKIIIQPVVAPYTKSSIDSVLYTEKFLKNEPFLLCFGDDLMDDEIPPSKSLMEIFYTQQKPVIAIQRVPKEKTSAYGIYRVKKADDGLFRITELVEKPVPDKAPSNLAGVGRYILPARIFDYFRIAKKHLDETKEVSIVDVLDFYLKDQQTIYGWLFKGKYFDGGSHSGLLKAQVHYALKHPLFGKEVKDFLKKSRQN